MYIGDDNSVDLTLDWDSAFGASVFAPAAVHASSVSDALILSLSNLGRVDIGYILAATGESYESSIEQFNGKLKGWLGFFDAAVVDPVPFESLQELNVIRPKGGGGTRFDVIFSYVEQKMDPLPVSIVILTDGHASFPPERA